MSVGFTLSGPAARDLDDLLSHLETTAGRRVARQVANRLLRACRSLATDPGLGHRRGDLTAAPVRFWPVWSYLVVYRPDSVPLSIVRILHASRDARRLLDEEE